MGLDGKDCGRAHEKNPDVGSGCARSWGTNLGLAVDPVVRAEEYGMDHKISFEYLTTNGIKLHTALAGPEDGELVFLLHGFPEAWFGWEAQILSLAEAGFRVAAPDQRGYNLSDKPKGVASYQSAILVEDIIGLADGLGVDQFYLAGHDFGAMVSWNMARRYPERIKRMVIANVPHPRVMQKVLRSSFSQLMNSWYAIFSRSPGCRKKWCGPIIGVF